MKLHPGEDFASEVGAEITIDNWRQVEMIDAGEQGLGEPSHFVRQATCKSALSAGPRPGHADTSLAVDYARVPAFSDPGTDSDSEHSDEETNIVTKLDELNDELQRLNVHGYFGKASGPVLYTTAVAVKNQASSEPLNFAKMSAAQRPQYWTVPSVGYRHSLV